MELFNEIAICSAYVCALEYGDYSGLNGDEEEALVNSFVESLPACSVFQWSDESDFSRDEISGLMADCLTCSVYASAENIRKLESRTGETCLSVTA